MLADYKRPRAYRLVDSLPMTATGKKMHFRVRESAVALLLIKGTLYEVVEVWLRHRVGERREIVFRHASLAGIV